MLSKVYLFIFLGLISIFFPTLSMAQSPFFAVTPTKVELVVTPGDTEVREITILNNLGTTATFRLVVEDYTLNSGAKTVSFLADESSPFSLKKYLTISDREFILLPGQSKKVLTEVYLPATTPIGSLHGAVLVEAEPDTGIVGATRINSRVGVLFFVKVAGKVVERGGLKSFGAVGGPIQLGTLLPPTVFISYRNDGNTYVNPYGFIEVRNIFGQKVATEKVSPWFVLPQTTRVRDVSLNQNSLVGIYFLKLYQNRGYQDIVDQDFAIMIRLPWFYIGIISLLIVILIVSFSLMIKFKK